jgi:translation elongation factor EF-G
MAANETRASLLVVLPAAWVGDVSGELSRRGAWLDGLTSEDDVCSVKARMPVAQVPDVEVWLKRLTRGTGRVVNVGE